MAEQNTEIASVFSLRTFRVEGRDVACIEIGGRCFPIEAAGKAILGTNLPDSVIRLFDDWETSFQQLQLVAANVDKLKHLELESRAIPLAPLLYPGKVLCAGANYYDHLAEMGVADSHNKAAQRLFFFFKPSRQSVVGPGDTVHMPLDCTKLDWEVELALVIGRTARALTLDNALSHVAAYAPAIDFSARNLNRVPDTFFKFDWVAGKAHDTLCPLGPALVPAAFVAEPQDLGMRLSVNGEIKQNARTSGMIFDIREQLVTLSRIMTLDPGDVVLTGTPAGVGAAKGTFLSVGDTVLAEIDGLGGLEVRIQSPK